MDKPDRKRLQDFLKPYRVTKGKGFRLADRDPGDTHGLTSEHKGRAAEMLARGVDWLAEEQEKLYAQDRWACCSCSRRWTPRARTARSST